MRSAGSRIDTEIVEQLRLHATGRSGDEQPMNTMLSSRFFVQAPEYPGFLACPAPGGPLIPVFTSQRRLARHAGEVRWFSITGADLVSMAPVGHRFVIDPGSSHEALVDPARFEKF